MKYRRVTYEDRIRISELIRAGKTDLKNVTTKDLKRIEFEINNRPMKCLDWKTPYEIMLKKN